MKLQSTAQDRIAALVADTAKKGFQGVATVPSEVAPHAPDGEPIIADGNLYVRQGNAVYSLGAVAELLPELAGKAIFDTRDRDKQFTAGAGTDTNVRGRGLVTTHTLAAQLPAPAAPAPLDPEQARALARATFNKGIDALVKKEGAGHTGGLAKGAQDFWVATAATGSIAFDALPEAARSNLTVVAAYLKQAPGNYNFKSVAEPLRDHDALVQLVVAQDGEALEYASKRLRGDKKTVLIAVAESGEGALEHASDALRGDIDVGTVAVNNVVYAYRHLKEPAKSDTALIRHFAINSWASPRDLPKTVFDELRKDPAFVLAHVTENPRAVRDTFTDYHDNDEVMRAAIKGDAEMLEYASERVRKDPKVVLEAVRQNGRAWEFADPSIRSRPDIMLAAMASEKDGWVATSFMKDDPEASKRFKDRDFVMKAIPLEERVFWNATSFHADREVVTHAMKHFGGMSFAKAFKADPEIATIAVNKNPGEIKYVSTKTPGYDALASQALAQDPHLIWDLPARFGKDREVVKKLVAVDAALLNHVDKRFMHDPEVLRIAVDGNNVHADQIIAALKGKGDREAVLVLAQSKSFFEYYGQEAAKLLTGFTNDRDIMLGVVRQNPEMFSKVGAKLKKDPAFVLAALNANGAVLRALDPEQQQKREFVMAALKDDTFRLNDYGNKLDLSRWLGNRDFAKELLAENGARLRDMPAALRGDRELVAIACKQAWRNIVFATDPVRTDADFVAGLQVT